MSYKKACTVFFLNVILHFFFVDSTRVLNAQEPLNTWESMQPLPQALSSHQSIQYNNNIYVFGGGAGNTYSDDILMSHIDENGNLGEWISAGNIPQPMIWHTVINSQNNLYMIGGAISDPKPSNSLGVTTISKVYKATISANGFVENWNELPPLPKAAGRGGAFIYLNKLYYLGGITRTSPSDSEQVSSSLYSLPLDSAQGSWTSLTSIPKPLAEFALFTRLNKIFVVGGMNTNTSPSKDIFEGNLLENGSIEWTLVSTLPEGLRRPAFAQNENTYFLFGGYNGSSFQSTVYYSLLDNNLRPANWVTSSHEIPPSCCNTASSNNEYVYILGRHDGATYYNDVLRSQLLKLLSVPSFKQTDPLWASITYDSANIWSPTRDEISRWGCALTSASMLLSYYGHPITPESLNVWLLNNNGYVGNGLVNWSAVTKYAKISHDINPLLPKLEYKRYSSLNNSTIESELQKLRPVILKLNNPTTDSSHFIVITGKFGSNYYMNDPATTNSLLNYYDSHNIQRIDTFIPSNTDLSYMYLYSSPNISIQVYKPDGNLILEGYEEEKTIEDQIDHSAGPGNNLQTFTLGKPQQGTYIIKIKGDGQYNLLSHLYDINAAFSQNSFIGVINKNTEDTYIIELGSNTKTEKIDYQFLRNFLKEGYDKHKIKNKALYTAYLNLLNLSEKHFSLKRIAISRNLVNEMLNINKTTTLIVDKDYSLKLKVYLQYLYNSI